MNALVVRALLVVAVFSAVTAIVAPYVLTGLQVPIPPEVWSSHATAIGGGLALLVKLIDRVS